MLQLFDVVFFHLLQLQADEVTVRCLPTLNDLDIDQHFRLPDVLLDVIGKPEVLNCARWARLKPQKKLKYINLLRFQTIIIFSIFGTLKNTQYFLWIRELPVTS